MRGQFVSQSTLAQQIFEEVLEGDRRKMVTVAGGEDQTEEIDAYRKLREEAAPVAGPSAGVSKMG